MIRSGMSRRNRSISSPIIFGSASVALTLALLVGWIYVILQNPALGEQWTANLWLLISGVVSFTAIMTVLTLFSVFLARQIIEIRRQTTFVDSVTHELRSPLASIRLGLETLGREGLDVAQREQLREMMLDDVERLSGFIGDILEANRIEHGSHVRASNLVSLAELVDRCVKTVTKRHKLDPAQVKVDVDPELEFETDATALETVLKNLLDNAVKYSDSPAEVLVTAQCRDRRLLIAVEDNGVGIPRRLLKRVFDRFYRVDEETTRARRGTGLGLFVVRALVRGLGGRLRAHSEGLGTGTRVTVELPLETKVPEAAPGKAFG